MNEYKRIIELFEQVKDTLNPAELQYILNQIEEYDSCTNKEEAERLEKGMISFCEKKIAAAK